MCVGQSAHSRRWGVLCSVLFIIATVPASAPGHAHRPVPFDGWVPIGVAPGQGYELSHAFTNTVFEWVRRQPTIVAQLGDRNSEIGRLYNSPVAFRATLLTRYPFLAAERIPLTTLRQRLPRRAGRTGVTVPPFTERGSLPTAAAATAATSSPRAPIPVPRPVEEPISQLFARAAVFDQQIESLSENQQRLRTDLAALERRVVVLGQVAEQARVAAARSIVPPGVSEESGLPGGVSYDAVIDRLKAVEGSGWWWRVVGLILLLLFAALFVNAVAMWKRVRASERELVVLRSRVPPPPPPPLGPLPTSPPSTFADR